MSAASPPPAAQAKIPSLPRRILVASLRMVGLLIVFVAIPLGLLQFLSSHGVTPPYSLLTVSAVGIVLAILGASATVARPTQAYGPLALASSVILFLWLLALAKHGVVQIGIGSGGYLQLSYGNAILLVALVPLLLAVAAIGTTAEDLRRPGERLPFDYPP
ncbi:MAG: hypothetical protein L3K00_07425 [Thermoplasmata archaeon]|nr:hypothetical protein [Thermoplasmata archaeon]